MGSPESKKSSRRNRKKKQIQDLSTKPSILPDDEQIAMENLFDASSHEDNLNYQQKFNTTFDMFRSVDFQNENPETLNPIPSLMKTARDNVEKTYHPESVEIKRNQNFSETKKYNNLTKNYEIVHETFSTRSSLLRIRKGMRFKNKSKNEKNPSVLNELKSKTVFVGKINEINSFTKNLSNPSKHCCQKNNTKNHERNVNLFNHLFRSKLQSINDQVHSYIWKKSPDSRGKNIIEPILKNQKLERIKRNPLDYYAITNFNYSQLSKDQKYHESKEEKNFSFMNNRILGLDEFSDYCFQNRQLNYRRQRK